MKKLLRKVYSAPFLMYAIIALAFAMILFMPTDPDFFWHLKYGELTFHQGPISYDPYSYTFSNFQFFDYQWGSNLLMYILYMIGKFYLLATVYGLFVIGALVISVNIPIGKKVPQNAKLIMIFAALLITKSVIGIRPQTVSILAIAMVYYCVINFLKGKTKYIYAVPMIMLVWANLHPGFLSGLILLGIVFWSQWIKVLVRPMLLLFESPKADKVKLLPKRELGILSLIVLLSILVTLITPFSYNILKQSFTFATDSYAQDFIQEWLAPNTHRISGLLTILYTFFVAFSFYRRKSVGFTEAMVLLAFGFMTLQTIRHIPLFVVLSMPSILAVKDWEKLDIFLKEKNPLLFGIHVLAFLTSIFVAAVLLADFLIVNSKLDYVERKAHYPYRAVEFIKKNEYSGRIFNTYRYGGYLIWALPEEKVFIDGRMTSWTIGDERILQTYQEIHGFEIPDWQDKLDDYNVNLILAYKKVPMAHALREVPEWRIVFEDDRSIVYVRSDKL